MVIGERHALAALPPCKWPSPHWRGGGVGPIIGRDASDDRKICRSCWGYRITIFRLYISQPSHYTACFSPAAPPGARHTRMQEWLASFRHVFLQVICKNVVSERINGEPCLLHDLSHRLLIVSRLNAVLGTWPTNCRDFFNLGYFQS